MAIFRFETLRNLAVAFTLFVINKLAITFFPLLLERVPYKPQLIEPAPAFWRKRIPTVALVLSPASQPVAIFRFESVRNSAVVVGFSVGLETSEALFPMLFSYIPHESQLIQPAPALS